jgi:hypothetical protein
MSATDTFGLARQIATSLMVLIFSIGPARAVLIDLNDPDVKTCREKALFDETLLLVQAMEEKSPQKSEELSKQAKDTYLKGEAECWDTAHLHEKMEAYRRGEAARLWASTQICDWRRGAAKPYPRDAGHTPEREAIFNEERAKFAQGWKTDDIDIACSRSAAAIRKRYESDHPESRVSDESLLMRNDIEKQRRDLDTLKRETDDRLEDLDDQMNQIRRGQ